MTRNSKYWFKRRRYGWGWTPVTREGWLSVIIGLVVILLAAIFILPPKPETPTLLQLILFFLILLSVISFMLGISYAKGPLPRWRWGKSPQDNPDEDI